MDTIRFILIIVFAMLSMKLWTTWQSTYAPETASGQTQGTAETQAGTASVSQEVPDLADITGDTQTPGASEAITQELQTDSETVDVITDVFQIRIDTLGAGINYAALTDYPVDIDRPDQAFVLMQESPENFFITQGGLLSRQTAPTHESEFQTGRREYRLLEQQENLIVPFMWSENGIDVIKEYHFTRGSHLATIKYRISNSGNETWSGRSYHQIKRNNPGRGGNRFIYTYTGTVISDPENRYEKIAFDDIDEAPLARDITDGWIAVIQHYFLTALVPTDRTTSNHFYTRALGNNLYNSGLVTPQVNVSPGAEVEITQQVYIGPKDQGTLAAIAEGLDLTVDYGMLWFIAKPLFLLLSKINELVGNWGWAIIIVTILLKLAFYKLSAAGYRSMAKMRNVQPRMVSLRERFKDDRVRLNQAMMQLYKEEKINPFGGCFPILVQIPVFIALYWVLLESIELRQAGFVLWLNDLSTRDPFYVLPLIMGATMFVQQKLNPAPLDPVQAKVMTILPVVFTVFFAFFPSGLVLYWVANNTLSILQQWLIMRNLEKAGLDHSSK